MELKTMKVNFVSRDRIRISRSRSRKNGHDNNCTSYGYEQRLNREGGGGYVLVDGGGSDGEHDENVIDGCNNSGHAKTPPLSLSTASPFSSTVEQEYKEETVRRNTLGPLLLLRSKKSDTSHSIPYHHQRNHHRGDDDGQQRPNNIRLSKNNNSGTGAPFKAKHLSFPRAKMSTQLVLLLVSLVITMHLQLGTIAIAEATPTAAKAHRHGRMADVVDSEYPFAPSSSSDMTDGQDKKFVLTPDDIQERIHQDFVKNLPGRESYVDTNSNLPQDEERFYDGVDEDNGVYQEQQRRYSINSTTTDQDSYIPEKPLGVNVTWVTDSMMELSWQEPTKPNGKIDGYRIYYMWRNFTEVETVKQPLEHMKFALGRLEAFTEYKVWVKPFTWKNEGESSDPIVVKTDVRGPSPPKIVNVSCVAEDAIYITWQRPTKFFNSIDFFYVEYRSEEWPDFEEITVAANVELNEQFAVLQNLTTNMMFELRVRGGTRSVLEPEKVYKGQYSDSRKILIKPNCEKVQIRTSPRTAHEFTPAMVAATVCVSFGLLFILIAVLVWRRCFQGAYYYLDDPPRIPPLLGGTGWEGDSTDELKRAIPAHLFPKHVGELHADGDIGFSKEYELIQAASVQEEFASEHSQHPENKQKNRYLNIVAYDHTRVRLQPLPGQKKCIDYVNANYIDGFRKPQAYIGTQGPLPSTFDSFWRMVWEHNVHIIVMITNLVERGRKKCDMYWPKEGTETHGVIQVRFIKEDVLSTYTVRTFLLRHLRPVSGSQLKKKKQTISERTVYHYHYTNWPDHGTPSHPLPVLSFVKKSSAANPPDAGPIIVHCSAGVGRTGTYIVLDAMLRQIRARGDLNIYGFLNHIRKQRNFLVQTEEQYIFIHDAMLEAIQSGETNVNVAYLSRYIHSLLSGSYADEKSEVSCLLERQFKLVTQFSPKDFHQSSALKSCNLGKNRNIDNVCTDAYRVSITPKPGVEGSEYINATFVPGFRRLQEFIITQHPLESTIPEFWQMLWDHSVQTIVILTAMDDQEYPVFWPSSQEGQDYDTFRVNNQHEHENNGLICRDFSLQSLQDDYDLTVKMVHCPMWPHSVPPPISSLLDLVTYVQECTRESHLGPVAVIDRFGGTEAATFCSLTTSMKQINYENHADIYMFAKLYHEQRPGVWRSPDDFLLLYRCVESMVSQSNGGTMPTPTSPSPLLPPPSIESFLASQVSTSAPNGHLNGVIIHNGNGRIPPEGMETMDASGDPVV